MIWITNSLNKRLQHYMSGEELLGTLYYTERTKRFVASTPHIYLGQFGTHGEAAKAVEDEIVKTGKGHD